MSKIMIYLYTTEEQIHQFSIVYMINLPLHIDKMLIEQVGKFLRAIFHENTMENIRNIMKKKYT